MNKCKIKTRKKEWKMVVNMNLIAFLALAVVRVGIVAAETLRMLTDVAAVFGTGLRRRQHVVVFTFRTHRSDKIVVVIIDQ